MDAVDALEEEPAILYLIFRELSQLDLLRVQSVCRTWRRTITTNTELLTIQWLHPGSSKKRCDTDKAAFNPLLKEAFPSFYDSALTPNMFRLGYGNHGLWSDLGRHLTYLRSPCDLPQDRQRCEKFMRPEASWRRMLPCWPPADELQVNLDCCYDGPSRLARLGFRNDQVDNAKTTKSNPPWLCFGLIYDLLEAAWFQGVPNYVSSVQFEYLGLDQRAAYGFCPIGRDALVSEEFRSSTIPRAGRVSINIHLDLIPEEERQKIHAEAFQNRGTEHANSRRMFAPKQCVPRRSPEAPYIFRDEFHFDDGLSFEDIAVG